jgi:microcystin-dependent protein
MSKAYKPVSKYISSKSIFFPIGMVLITVTNINPTNWCQGTWESFGQGRCLVGIDTSQSEFNTLLKTGGEKVHLLAQSELPSEVSVSANVGSNVISGTSKGAVTSWVLSGLRDVGMPNSQPHNNLQPYICVYFWRKTSN